ncbi:MAG: hypothetical protein AAFR44_02135, partial [Pseudomonadota bacterium]
VVTAWAQIHQRGVGIDRAAVDPHGTRAVVEHHPRRLELGQLLREALVATAAASTVFFEMVGPIATRIALRKTAIPRPPEG